MGRTLFETGSTGIGTGPMRQAARAGVLEPWPDTRRNQVLASLTHEQEVNRKLSKQLRLLELGARVSNIDLMDLYAAGVVADLPAEDGAVQEPLIELDELRMIVAAGDLAVTHG